MQFTKDPLDEIATIIGNDTFIWAGGILVHLAKATFTPNEGNVLADFEEADFGSYAAKAVAAGPVDWFMDPVSMRRTLMIPDPVGGWAWVTSNDTNLPQTIYGFYITDDPATVVISSQLFDVPVLLTGHPEGVNIGSIKAGFSGNFLR